MKKFILFIIAFMFVSMNFFAQQQIIVGNDYVKPNEVSLVAERGISTTLQFKLNELNLSEIVTDYGLASKLSSAKAPVMLDAGNPELIYFDASFIIPDVGSADLEITYTSYTDYENVEIVPSKGNLPRSIDPETVPYVKGEVYHQDAFFPGTLATLYEPFIMRDVRGQTIFVYPVQYNPVSKVLRVYSEITVNMVYNENEGVNEFTTQKRNSTLDPTFHSIYDNLFINYSTLTRGYPTLEEGEMLIICHPPFADDMKPYIDWKRTIGRKTTLVTTTETGTSVAALKSYITTYYNNPDHNLAYLLFVGDAPQIPAAGTVSVPSDIEYGMLEGNNYLTILVGRMSCENLAHVQTQVQRSIWYERNIATADTRFGVGVGVAVSEGQGGGHDGGEADYVHMNNIRNRLLEYGYNPIHQEYYNYQGSTGVPPTSNTQISQRFNDGASIANYCNHGSKTAWTPNGGPNYSNTQVEALQNAGKLPFIFSVACNNGEFTWTGGVCFAEAWLRSTQGGQPTGAIATLMATISLGWLPPMTAQDEFVDLCMDIRHTAGGFNYGLVDHRLKTFAGTALNATQKMILRHGSSGMNDYKSWTVFGDPTLMIRTKTPQEMNISHSPTIPIGASEFSVDCDADGAVATVSYIDDDDEVIIVGSAIVVDGVSDIVFDEPLAEPVELTIAVVGFNKVTYISDPIQAGGTLELPEPLNLSFHLEKVNHVVLNWEAPKNGKSLTLKGYHVYRNDVKITPTPVNEGETYTDIAPENGTYKYEITAVYGAKLESDPSNSVMALIEGMCVPVENIIFEEIDETSLLISWDSPNYEGVSLLGYNVYRDSEIINPEIIPLDILSFLDEDLVLATRYCYQVEVVYSDCDETVISVENCHSLSINDIHASVYSIFPNPANGEVTIEGTELTRVELYDVQGRRLVEFTNLQDKLNVSHLENGLYFVKLYSNDNAVGIRRLVVIK